MKNVIITGANGFIGSSLIKELLKRGTRIVAIDISFAASMIPDNDNVIKIEAGLDDIDYIKKNLPIAGYDAMYHLAWAGVNGAAKADPYIQLNNIRMGVNCAVLCREFKVKKLLCAGTVAEQNVKSLDYLETTTGGMMYGVAKHAAHIIIENYCKNVGQPFVWMQFSNIYGIGNKTGNLISYALNELLTGKDATFGPAEQPYDFIYINDLLEAVIRLGECKTNCSTYFIGSGQPRILKEYLLRVGELCGMREKVCIGARPDDGIKYEKEMFCTSSLVNDIGEYVNITFDEGISKTIDWFKTQI